MTTYSYWQVQHILLYFPILLGMKFSFCPVSTLHPPSSVESILHDCMLYRNAESGPAVSVKHIRERQKFFL